MEEFKDIFKLGEKSISLLDKILGPGLTRRQADADAQAVLQGALAEQVATHLELHPNDPVLLDALISCGGKTNFNNLVRIVKQAIPQMDENAVPDLISDDWGANFREKARTCSDPDMATLWAQLLAGEANNPGSYSRKTVNILGDIEPKDALLFRNLSMFQVIPVDPVKGAEPLFYKRSPIAHARPVILDDHQHPSYIEMGITGDSLDRMAWLGLIEHYEMNRVQESKSDRCVVFLCGDEYIYVATPRRKSIDYGCVKFTQAGEELAELCVPVEMPEGFIDYVIGFWQEQGARATRDISELPSILGRDLHGS